MRGDSNDATDGGLAARRAVAWTAVALVLCLARPEAGIAQAHGLCVPGSIGPGGCDSIRPQDQPEDPFALDLVLPSDQPLDPRRGALRDLDGVDLERLRRLGLAEPGLLRRVRPTLPPPPDPALGRDPRALRSFQAPYASD